MQNPAKKDGLCAGIAGIESCVQLSGKFIENMADFYAMYAVGAKEWYNKHMNLRIPSEKIEDFFETGMQL